LVVVIVVLVDGVPVVKGLVVVVDGEEVAAVDAVVPAVDAVVLAVDCVVLAVDPTLVTGDCLVEMDCVVVLAGDGVLLVVVEGVTVVEAVVRFSVINGVVRVLVDAVDVDAAVDVVWH